MRYEDPLIWDSETSCPKGRLELLWVKVLIGFGSMSIGVVEDMAGPAEAFSWRCMPIAA